MKEPVSASRAGVGEGAGEQGVPPIAIRPGEWEIVQAILRRHVPGWRAWAFGSRARGRAKPYSDLDLALLGPRPLAADEAAALAEAFSESDLPWRVDVVDLASASEAFRRAIEPDRVLVQEGSCGPTA